MSRPQWNTVVLTRFAIEPDTELKMFTSRNAEHFLSDDWFDQRLDLFKEYCLPSVLGQSDKSFDWLLFVDGRVSRDRIDRLKSLVIGIGRVVIVGSGAFAETVNKELGSASKLLTLRLDSDDAIAPKFVETAKRKASAETGLNFLHGADFHLQKGIAFHRVVRSNAFVAIASDTGNHVFVYRSHPEIAQNLEIRNVCTVSPMWVHIVHHLNTSRPRKTGIPVILFRNRLTGIFDNQQVVSFTLVVAVREFFSHIGAMVFRFSPRTGLFLNRIRWRRQ